GLSFPLLAHKPNPRRSQQLVRDSQNFAVFPPRHADPDDFFFRHHSDDATRDLKRFRRLLTETDRAGLERRFLERSLADGHIWERNRWRLEKLPADDVNRHRQFVLLIVHVGEPVDDGPVARQVTVRLELLPELATNLVR